MNLKRLIIGATSVGIIVLGFVSYLAFSRGRGTPPVKPATKPFPSSSKDYVAGEIIVSFKPEVTRQQAKAVIQQLGASIKRPFNDPATSNSFLLQVEVNHEEEVLKKFQSNPLVLDGSLNYSYHLN